MIRPERMSRLAIVGPRKRLDAAIRILYKLNLFHLVDFVEEEEDIQIGTPLPGASTTSQRLLRLRSIIRALGLEEFRPDRRVSVSEIERTSDQAIVTLELEVSKKVEVRQQLSGRIKELRSQNELLELFAELGLPLEAYGDYDNLTVFCGSVQSSVEDKLRALSSPMEIVEVSHSDIFAIAVFCRNRDAETVQRILAEAGYQELEPPFNTGTAKEHLRANDDEIEKLERALAGAEEEIEALRDKYAPLVIAAEEHYSIEIQKAEAPLRIATTPNSFIIDGWAPKSSCDLLVKALRDELREEISIEALEISKTEEDEQAPVKLKNVRVAKPFELFVEVMSTPLYREVDPTIFLTAVFPLFFGLMIGDFGYGLGMLFVGWLMLRKWGRESLNVKRLAWIVIAGGIFSCIFGMFLFGEAFGLPFHAPPAHPDEPSWEFLFSLPIHPIMEKLIDVKEYLVLSVVAGWIHMTLGLILGFFNELRHDRRHAAVKILWLVILFAIFLQMLFVARWTVIGGFFFDLFGAPFESLGTSFAGMTISYVAVGLIVAAGAGFFAVMGGAGAMEFIEIPSLVTNVISYTRLAGIGVAKGAMALAFNTIVIDAFFSGGSIPLIIVGAVILVLLQLLVFALGSISSGIQALRLNYVEFFLKFFKGGGVSFNPLGYERKYSIASEV